MGKLERDENPLLPDYDTDYKTLRKVELARFWRGVHGHASIVIMKHGIRKNIKHVFFHDGEIRLVTE